MIWNCRSTPNGVVFFAHAGKSAVADLGGARRVRPNFSQFHAVFHKIWQNHMLAPPLECWRPLLRGILDPPLVCVANIANVVYLVINSSDRTCILILFWTKQVTMA